VIDDRNEAAQTGRGNGPTQLLTIAEVARRLSVGRDRVYLLLAQGELSSVHLGRSHRVTARSLAAYVDRAGH